MSSITSTPPVDTGPDGYMNVFHVSGRTWWGLNFYGPFSKREFISPFYYTFYPELASFEHFHLSRHVIHEHSSVIETGCSDTELFF